MHSQNTMAHAHLSFRQFARAGCRAGQDRFEELEGSGESLAAKMRDAPRRSASRRVASRESCSKRWSFHGLYYTLS